MALPAFIGTGLGIINETRELFGGKDGERLAANKAAYDAAIAGDDDALLFLRQRSGNYGTTLVPGYGEVGGWATDTARSDANKKYNQVVGVRQAGAVADDVADAAQDLAQRGGVTILPGTQKEISTALIIGVVAVVLVVIVALKFWKRRK